MRKINIVEITTFALLFASCSSANFNEGLFESKSEKEFGAENIEQETLKNKIERENDEYQQKLKEIDIEKTIVYVNRPVYTPITEEKPKKVTGTEAARKSTQESTQIPEKYVRGAMYYDFDNDFTYEVYCQPYRVTDIQLEPGEQVLEMPFLSENQVWEIGAGVSRVANQDVQHFFLKPSMSGLTTSMIIITDKRIYHLMLKSFKNTYMSIVRWEYPNTLPFKLLTTKGELSRNGILKNDASFIGVDPQYMSFDYKMTYSAFKKPYWLPTLAYDDGRRTYIRMNETVLHRESPVVFNNKNELVNYRVQGNLIIIDQLLDKVTLKRNNEKVVIKKKNYKPDPNDIRIEDDEYALATATETSRNLNFSFKTKGSGGFGKNYYVPITVYDDGKVTHLKMNEKVFDDLPAIFDEKSNTVDYRISSNEILIDRLIDKIIVVAGKRKCTITNLSYKNQIKNQNQEKSNKNIDDKKGGLVISSYEAADRRRAAIPPKKEDKINIEVNYPVTPQGNGQNGQQIQIYQGTGK